LDNNKKNYLVQRNRNVLAKNTILGQRVCSDQVRFFFVVSLSMMS